MTGERRDANDIEWKKRSPDHGMDGGIDRAVKTAMKAKDQATLSVLRMVKTQLQLKASEPGFTGELTDEITLAVHCRLREEGSEIHPGLREGRGAGQSQIGTSPLRGGVPIQNFFQSG